MLTHHPIAIASASAAHCGPTRAKPERIGSRVRVNDEPILRAGRATGFRRDTQCERNRH